MEEYRCRSYADGRMEIERYTYNNNNNNNNGGNNNQSQKPSNLTNYNDYDDNNNNSNSNFNGVTRSYSASYATTAKGGGGGEEPKELRKYKRANGSFSCFGDPEMQRKRRVASYRGYSVEAKLKKSFSKSFKWIKDRYSRVVHGD